MTSNDSGLQDGTIPLLTEVLEGNAPPSPPTAAPVASSPPPVPTRPVVQAPNVNQRAVNDDDSGIPVLTVPLQTSAVAPPARPRPAPPAAQTAQAATPIAVPPGQQRATTNLNEGGADAMLARLTADEMEQLQHKLSERILRQLQGRIDFVLEQRVRDSLADVLQLAMGGLTNDIKRGLQQTLEEVVGRAVAQEIARLQSGKK